MQISTPQPAYDVVVVGGGMVGASFAHALATRTADKPISVLVVEAVAHDAEQPLQPSFDARSTALAYGSRLIFEHMGLWSKLKQEVNPIAEIQVSDRGRFGSTRLHHDDFGVEALGYVIENARLGRVLHREMAQATAIDMLCPASISAITPLPAGMKLSIAVDGEKALVEAGLVVLADGGKSPICKQLGIQQRVEHYGQQAIISNVAFEQPHRDVAYERFTNTGPVAVLPLAEIYDQHIGSLVWSVKDEQCEEVMALDDAAFLQALQARFGNRLGNFTRVAKRFSYPLSLTEATEQIRPGLALLGNVAHTLHPVAGQGLNLALRDIEALVKILGDALEKGESVGDMGVLQRYLDGQQGDQQQAIFLTDTLTRMFSSDAATRVWSRKFGLLSLNLLPPLKRAFAQQAMGLK